MDIQSLRKMRNSDFGAISSAFEKVANPQSEQKSLPMIAFGDSKVTKQVMAQPLSVSCHV